MEHTPATGRGPRRAARLYRRSLGVHLRAALEYENDFWIMILGAVLVQVVGLAFLGAVFARVPDLDGWRLPEVLLIFSLVVLAEGVGSLCYEGIWRLAWRVNEGQLDYMLVRPYPVLLQVMSGDVGLNGLGNLVTGTALLGWALTHADIAWSPGVVLLAPVLLVSALLVKLAITVASNAAAFWLLSSTVGFAYALHQVGDLARYPITIYATGVRAVLTAVLPFAFVSYFPASAVLGHGDHAEVGFATPAVAAGMLAVALLIFRRGLRRYEGAGA